MPALTQTKRHLVGPSRALYACLRKAATLLHVKPPPYAVTIEENEECADPYTVRLVRLVSYTSERTTSESAEHARDLDQVWELVRGCIAFHPSVLILKDEPSDQPELKRKWVVYDPKTRKPHAKASGPIFEPFAR